MGITKMSTLILYVREGIMGGVIIGSAITLVVLVWALHG